MNGRELPPVNPDRELGFVMSGSLAIFVIALATAALSDVLSMWMVLPATWLAVTMGGGLWMLVGFVRVARDRRDLPFEIVERGPRKTESIVLGHRRDRACAHRALAERETRSLTTVR